MAIVPWFYEQASKGFRNEPARKVKDALRPVKQAIAGKNGIYKAIEVAEDMQKRKGLVVKTVFDVGAAIGEAALPMAKAFPDAQLYCFEPLPESYVLLRKRTKKFEDRIHYFNHGLSNKDEVLEFYVQEGHHDGSSLIAPRSMHGIQKTSIPVKKLDEVCQAIGVTHIDFMKIDVEGMEKEMIEGAEKILRHTDNVFVEISPERKNYNHDYIDVFEHLHAAGLSFIGVYDDYFFTRREKE